MKYYYYFCAWKYFHKIIKQQVFMIRINNCSIERSPVGWLVDYPGMGIRFPLSMPLQKVLLSVLCSLCKFEKRK